MVRHVSETFLKIIEPGFFYSGFFLYISRVIKTENYELQKI